MPLRKTTTDCDVRPPTVLLVGGSGVVGCATIDALVSHGVRPSVMARKPNPAVDHLGDLAEPTDEVADLVGSHDVVVNLAANTQWTMTDDEAHHANVLTARNVARLSGENARLVHVSTSFLGGRPAGSDDSDGPFRNAYERSKMLSEQAVLDCRPDAHVVRLPQIVGSRRDGTILRYEGLYSLVGALAFGLVPAIVGEPSTPVDIAPVDEAGALVAQAALGKTDRFEVLSSGPDGVAIDQFLNETIRQINAQRSEAGADLLPEIPLVSRETWGRLYGPLSQSIFGKLELKAIDLVMEFSQYTDVYHGATPTRVVNDPFALWEACVSRWIELHQRRVVRPLRQWRSRPE